MEEEREREIEGYIFVEVGGKKMVSFFPPSPERRRKKFKKKEKKIKTLTA